MKIVFYVIFACDQYLFGLSYVLSPPVHRSELACGASTAGIVGAVRNDLVWQVLKHSI